MSKNKNLYKAKKQKNDEFYTQLSDIENELQYYKQHFKGKIVFCNCDDPYESNFLKYFVIHFNSLGLEKLIVMGYSTSFIRDKEIALFNDNEEENKKCSYVVEISEVSNMDIENFRKLVDVNFLLKAKKNIRRKVYSDGVYPAGDFRSKESITLLKKADIVVTNPPFSLFREYIAQLMKYDKKFLIVGNKNAITYKEFFPLIKEDKVWLGCCAIKTFLEQGVLIRNFGNVGWFTNLDIPKRHNVLDLHEHYNPKKYFNYDNYDAINVDRIIDIPCDYDGVMGVPITFLEKYNPEQFEIITLGSSPDLFTPTKKYVGLFYHKPDGTKMRKHIACNQCLTIGLSDRPNRIYYTAINSDKFLILPYNRILIRKKKI